MRFDKFKNQTTVKMPIVEIPPTAQSRSEARKLKISLYFRFEGETLKQNAEVFGLVFYSICRQWCFLQNHELIFLADDKSLNLGNGNHDGRIYTTRYGSGVNEQIWYPITRADLTAISKSKTTEFQLGNFEGVFSNDLKALITNMLTAGTVTPVSTPTPPSKSHSPAPLTQSPLAQ